MSETGASGNRWEPTNGESSGWASDHADASSADPAVPTSGQASAEGVPSRVRPPSRRRFAAAAALVLSVGLGLGGVGLGRATAPGDRDSPVRSGSDDAGDGRGIDGTDRPDGRGGPVDRAGFDLDDDAPSHDGSISSTPDQDS